jgi:subtilisin family serine protease
MSNLINAMDWVLQNAKAPALMSMSLGSRAKSLAMKAAVDKAVGKGITVVAAAGNYNRDACEGSPAFIPSAITVGSTDNHDRRSFFSSYGKCLDIFAPGSGVVSADSKSDTSSSSKSGTSMATPHVSGAIALLLEKNPDMQPADVDKALKEAALKDVVTDPKPDSPNLFLHVGSGFGKKISKSKKDKDQPSTKSPTKPPGQKKPRVTPDKELPTTTVPPGRDGKKGGGRRRRKGKGSAAPSPGTGTDTVRRRRGGRRRRRKSATDVSK